METSIEGLRARPLFAISLGTFAILARSVLAHFCPHAHHKLRTSAHHKLRLEHTQVLSHPLTRQKFRTSAHTHKVEHILQILLQQKCLPVLAPMRAQTVAHASLAPDLSSLALSM
jgi:hypothetical protein